MYAGIPHIKPFVHYNFGYGKGLLIGCYECLADFYNASVMTGAFSLPSFDGCTFVKLIHKISSWVLAIIKPSCVLRPV